MSGGGGTSVSESGLPDWAQPYAEDAVKGAVGEYKAGNYGNVAGLTGGQTDALGRQQELGQRGGALEQIGQDSYGAGQAYRDAASGSGLFGSDALGKQTQALEGSIGTALTDQLGQLNTGASLGGALGSARNQAATERALTQTAGDIAGKELAARRGASLQGAQGVIGSGSQIQDQLGAGVRATQAAGGQLQQQAQNESDANYQATQRLFGLLGSGVTGQKQTTTQSGGK